MATTIKGLPTPTPDDQDNVPASISNLNEYLATRVPLRLTDSAQLYSMFPTPPEGLRATTGTGKSAQDWIGLNSKWYQCSPVVQPRSPAEQEELRQLGSASRPIIAAVNDPTSGMTQLKVSQGVDWKLLPAVITYATAAAMAADTTAYPDMTYAFVQADTGVYVRTAGAWQTIWSPALDTGWIDVPLAAGLTASIPVQCRRIGGVAYWRGVVNRTAGNFPLAANTLLTNAVPVGFRAQGAYGNTGSVVVSTNGNLGYARIDTFGELTLWPTTAAANAWMLKGLSGYVPTF